MPMLAYSAQKRAYSGRDQADWIRHWNAINSQNGSSEKNIDFRFTEHFPIRSPELLRVAMVEPKTIPAICTFRLNMPESKMKAAD